jgi:hypothetical protein
VEQQGKRINLKKMKQAQQNQLQKEVLLLPRRKQPSAKFKNPFNHNIKKWRIFVRYWFRLTI